MCLKCQSEFPELKSTQVILIILSQALDIASFISKFMWSTILDTRDESYSLLLIILVRETDWKSKQIYD